MHFSQYYILYISLLSAGCVIALAFRQFSVPEFDDNFLETDDDAYDLYSKSAYFRYQNVNSMEEFLDLLITEDGRKLEISDVFSSFNKETKNYVKDKEVAHSDDCSPRNVTVKLNYDNTNLRIIYFPLCTQLEQCGGCCASPNMKCAPKLTENVRLKVFKAELESVESTKFIYQGYDYINVVRHKECEVKCAIMEEDCSPGQVYVPEACHCRCKVHQKCSHPFFWDRDVCSCVCMIQTECCFNGQRCGLVFDNQTCRCQLLFDGRLVASNTIHTQEQIRDYWSNAKNGELNMTDTQNQTSTGRSTISTTTEAPFTAGTADPCAKINCPWAFTKVVNPATNRCLCRLGFSSNGHGKSSAP